MTWFQKYDGQGKANIKQFVNFSIFCAMFDEITPEKRNLPHKSEFAKTHSLSTAHL